jgi:hypothetical protein
MELFNKALFRSQQKIFALTHRRVYTVMVNLFQILNQFVLLFRKNVIEKSSMIWRVLPLVKINTRISETPCISNFMCVMVYFLIKEPRPIDLFCKYKILLNLGNLMISIGYTNQRLSFLISLKVRKLAAKI